MAYLICEQISQGLRDSERTVLVRDIHGRKHFLRVEEAFLAQEGGRYWLPVGQICEDPEGGFVLIEFPQEAETGANRIWVRPSDLLQRMGAST
ncbi:MAG TPA: hypothetical protein VEL76_34550 [Gemmataceae bacterium]|nr:hypothetical protein [Gemmataceae bacterium]